MRRKWGVGRAKRRGTFPYAGEGAFPGDANTACTVWGWPPAGLTLKAGGYMPYATASARIETGDATEPETVARNPNGPIPGFGCVYLTRSVREAELASALVETAQIRIYHATGLDDARTRLKLTRSRVLLADTAIGKGKGWKDALQMAARLRPSTVLVVASRLADERLWLGVLEHGAYDLILKPFQADELRRVLENAHSHAITGGLRHMTA